MALIVDRQYDSLTGSQFAKNHMNTERLQRENYILSEIISGNIPNFLRHFVSVNITNGNDSITYSVMPNYISIGTDDDYIIMPVNAATAQKICDQFDCSLPTKLMVDQIWKASENKLEPIPHGEPYDSSMMSMNRYIWSDTEIKKHMIGKDLYKLTAGHKKDIIISNTLSPNNINNKQCIYGWHHLNGQPIQGKNYWSHELTYCDYAGCIRCVANDVVVNGSLMRLQDVLVHPTLSKLISDEGILTFLKY